MLSSCNTQQSYFCVRVKNIERGRNSSCYIALCGKSVGDLTPTVASHNTVTERQLFGFGNLWFYTFKNDLCLEKLLFNLSSKNKTTIYLQNVKKNKNIISQLNQWKLCVGYPQTVHDPSCCWQHKSCHSNILLVCLSWVRVKLWVCESECEANEMILDPNNCQ